MLAYLTEALLKSSHKRSGATGVIIRFASTASAAGSSTIITSSASVDLSILITTSQDEIVDLRSSVSGLTFLEVTGKWASAARVVLRFASSAFTKPSAVVTTF